MRDAARRAGDGTDNGGQQEASAPPPTANANRLPAATPKLGLLDILDRALSQVPNLPADTKAKLRTAALQEQHRGEALKTALRSPSHV